MRLGIMQPYIFPYIGYYQLVHSVDKMVFYDDVNFIKQGWINRNRILLNSKDFLFTVPLKDASSFKSIRSTAVDLTKYSIWKNKFLTTLTQSYKKAPFFSQAYPLVESILNKEFETIAELAVASIQDIGCYIGIKNILIPTSSIYQNDHLKASERIIDICKKENATNYINPIGGQQLYNKNEFSTHGIALNFIKSKTISYSQFNGTFIPWLSILDVLMFNSVGNVREMLDQFELV